MKCTCASNQPGVIKPPRRSTRSAVPASRARSDSRPTAATRKSDRRVSRDDADVFVAELGEHDTRAVRERGVPFDGHDIVRELCEHRGLISRPRAHLEHVMRRVDVQKLGHPRDDIWLRDRLTLWNSERVIAVRDVLVFLADKT